MEQLVGQTLSEFSSHLVISSQQALSRCSVGFLMQISILLAGKMAAASATIPAMVSNTRTFTAAH